MNLLIDMVTISLNTTILSKLQRIYSNLVKYVSNMVQKYEFKISSYFYQNLLILSYYYILSMTIYAITVQLTYINYLFLQNWIKIQKYIINLNHN